MGEANFKREKRHLVYPGWHLTPDDFFTFVQTDDFVEAWKQIGLDDDDLRAVETAIMADPEGHPEVPNTGGLRVSQMNSVQDGKTQPPVCVGYVVFR